MQVSVGTAADGGQVEERWDLAVADPIDRLRDRIMFVASDIDLDPVGFVGRVRRRAREACQIRIVRLAGWGSHAGHAGGPGSYYS